MHVFTASDQRPVYLLGITTSAMQSVQRVICKSVWNCLALQFMLQTLDHACVAERSAAAEATA